MATQDHGSPAEKDSARETISPPTSSLLSLMCYSDDQAQRVRHPIAENLPCPVLQYADDTLIMLRADASDAARLKQLLDSFSAATRLRINFSKSTMVPMHVAPDTLPDLLATLSCQCEGQAYLGLPLSNTKLSISLLLLPLSARPTNICQVGEPPYFTPWAGLS